MAKEIKEINNKNMTIKAYELAKKQREIGIAEFFAKNRHLLGFDNKRKALLTCVKEAVDNALDACEEAEILPEIVVEIINMGNDRYKVIVEDNGPGIIKKEIPKIFGKLLYGSKFHRLKQQRGQQGIGISACVMYSQLTTGKPVKIISKIAPDKPTHLFELMIDTKKNEPKVLKDETIDWPASSVMKDHGTRIEMDIEATYSKGIGSVDEYLKQTAIVNPHATIIYTTPKAEQILFVRATEQLPLQSKEIKPHPYGVELGTLIDMLQTTKYRTLQAFLINEFSRVGPGTAKEICENAALLPSTPTKQITREMAEQLINGIRKTKLMMPPTDCLSPIGAENFEKGLRKEINAEFYTSVTRSPSVYRGNPFVVEVAIAYGGSQSSDHAVRLLRFANRVPLLYQQGACAITKAIIETNWRTYGLQQSNGSLPIGPLTIAVHLASVWVPFTSESKESIAHYPEIIREIKLALQEVGRRLGKYIRKKRVIKSEIKKRSYIERYIPHVTDALADLLGLTPSQVALNKEKLFKILEKHRGKIESISMENPDYDEEFAKIGKEDDKENNSNEEV